MIFGQINDVTTPCAGIKQGWHNQGLREVCGSPSLSQPPRFLQMFFSTSLLFCKPLTTCWHHQNTGEETVVLCLHWEGPDTGGLHLCALIWDPLSEGTGFPLASPSKGRILLLSSEAINDGTPGAAL